MSFICFSIRMYYKFMALRVSSLMMLWNQILSEIV